MIGIILDEELAGDYTLLPTACKYLSDYRGSVLAYTLLPTACKYLSDYRGNVLALYWTVKKHSVEPSLVIISVTFGLSVILLRSSHLLCHLCLAAAVFLLVPPSLACLECLAKKYCYPTVYCLSISQWFFLHGFAVVASLNQTLDCE